MDLQFLADRLELEDVLHRYADAVDRRDWQQFRTCFTGDAHIDYSASGGAAGDLETVVHWLADTMVIFAQTQHFVTNVRVTIDGDAAAGRAYFYNPMTIAGDGGSDKLMTVGGYYNDSFRRTGEGWRIAQRIEEMAFMDTHPLG